jgi:predicted O-linked N-acetylglucosamine transferase (SPINDLY family)
MSQPAASAADPESELRLAHQQHLAGQGAAALATLQQLIARFPRMSAAHVNLAALLASQDRMTEARDTLRRATAALPNDTEIWIRLASIETHLGDRRAALDGLAQAVKTMPLGADLWRQIGDGYAEHWQYELADRALTMASALDPGSPSIETRRAFVKGELGDVAGALAALSMARAKEPGNLRVALEEKLMLPQVYESVEDVWRWRDRYEQGLADLERDIGAWLANPEQVFAIQRTNFLLAYQGEDDTGLQRRYAAFLGALSGAARPEWRRPLERRPIEGRRIRIGFVGSVFRDCTAGRYFERWITGLDPRFERFVYHTASLRDAVTERIVRGSEHFVAARGAVADIVPKILSDELDVLVYPEVGMDPVVGSLYVLRLAPLQLAGWGHPVTTGSDTIDAFITCGVMEPPDAQRHYVEPLIRLPGLGVQYARPAPIPALDRAKLGIAANKRMYVCAQALFKVDPGTDALFAEILERDPQGVLVFFEGASRMVTEALSARIQRALKARGVPARGQIVFLPRMSGEGFRAVLAAADVVLDTVRWSGGNTSIDAFASGTPVVTLPGEFMRGRQTAGMLELMGVRELIAENARRYVEIALKVARDNKALRHAIAERREALFDRPEPVAAFAESLWIATSSCSSAR